ncbi:MAG: SRPBCC family protein [Acidobacteria bacterium]|nr:MAG: SRPBCC family protein [Acidobacteriota bacterium]
MRKVSLIAAAILGGIVVSLLGAGLLLPAEHVAVTRARFDAPPEELFPVIADLGSWASWNSAVKEVRPEPARDGRPVFVVAGQWDEIPMVVEVEEPPLRLVTRIPEDAGLGFSGSWTYELAADGEGTVLTITERGRVSNPLFRLLVRLGDPHATAGAFLRDLGTRFGHPVEPIPISRGRARNREPVA